MDFQLEEDIEEILLSRWETATRKLLDKKDEELGVVGAQITG